MIYNFWGWKREDITCFIVVNKAVIVHDYEGGKIESQLVPTVDVYVELSYYARAYLGARSTSREANSVKETTRAERASVYAKSVAQSVEADTTSATPLSRFSSLQPTLRGAKIGGLGKVVLAFDANGI